MTSSTESTPALERVDAWLAAALERLEGGPRALDWLTREAAALDGGAVSDDRFAQRLSAASRFAPRGPLFPAPDHPAAVSAIAEAREVLPGWCPERWTALEALRVRLILARATADATTLPEALEVAFRYADEGELCALYRSLQFLPGPDRFRWRAGEGCRTNMKTVFEANACDTAYPAAHLDDLAWRQLVIKTLFVEAPLWRVFGLDGRVDDELARMALDLAEERRSAGRGIYPELWLCLGATASERALASIEHELDGDDELSRKGAVLALGRMAQLDRLREIDADGGSLFGPIAQWALMGRHDQAAFRAISIPEGATPETS